jgi:hypothetical protein
MRTSVGKIVFTNLAYPNHVSRLIDAYWRLVREQVVEAEKEPARETIREKQDSPTKTRSLLARLFDIDPIKLRNEDSDVITYRKHQITRLNYISTQITLFAIIFLALILQPYFLGGYTIWFSVLGVVLLIADSYWMRNRLAKWSSDYYQITPDQIIRFKATSIGQAMRESIAIEDLRSTQYERIGLFAALFNVGTVRITTTKNETLLIEDIIDPARVQAEIDARRMRIIYEKQKAGIASAIEGNLNATLSDASMQSIAEIIPESAEVELPKQQARPPLRVFLSYASQDRPAVREIYNALKLEGWIDPWLDKAKILPGQDWRTVIETAVEEADVVIVCFSNQSVSKEGYVQRELKYQ